MTVGMDYDPRSIFHVAQQGDTDAVKMYIKRHGYQVVRETDPFGRTALLISALEGHRRVVQLLLKFGADIRHVDVLGNSALALAAFHGWAKVVKVLLLHNQYVPSNYIDKVENDCHYLEKQETSEKYNSGIGAKVNIPQINVNGETALMLAAMRGYVDIVKTLLEEDHSKKHAAVLNHQGYNYIELAQMYGHQLDESLHF